MITYRNRVSAIAKEKNYELKEDGIGDGQGRWKFDDINLVELKYTPTRYYSGIYQCILHSYFGKEVISNRKYEGPANFKYQNEEFRGFITELHKQLSKVEGIEFKTGLSKASFYSQLMAMLLFMPLMVYVMVALGQMLLAALITLILLVRLVPFFQKNRPGHYDPLNIPNQLLPS